MKIRAIAKILYGLVGVSLLGIGVTVSLLRTGLLPDAVQNFGVKFTDGNPNALHITQEFGALMMFAGLITFWFIRHYERSKAFHWAMTIFWAFIALAHFGATHRLPGPIVNSVPFVLFAVVGLVRWRSERNMDHG
jgi:hypothetical protein